MATGSLGQWKDTALEQAVLEQVSIDVPWALVEEFSSLVRLSGSADEEKAVRSITGQLAAFGVDHTVHRPVCLISLPGPATLRATADNRRFTVKTPAFSPATGGK